MHRLTMASIIVAVLAMSSVVASAVYIRGADKLIIASTTSLYDTGLLDNLAENYREKYGTSLYFLALGTGQSLDHARRGDADAVMVHSPSLENIFLTEGSGGARKIIAYNFFAIVGPSDDPAQIENSAPLEALRKIRQNSSVWVSRGDNSGTHIKEKSLWASAGFDVDNISTENWYLQSGSGMGTTLTIANEREAYTLVDMGTFLKYRNDNRIGLDILVSQGSDLLNVYSVMAVNPENYPKLNFSGAIKFIEYLVSAEGQELIGNFGVSDYGQPLFYPAVSLIKENSDSQIAQWIREYAFFDNNECPSQYRLGHGELYS